MADRRGAQNPNFRIDSLHLRAPGRDPKQGALLGRRVAERLSEANVHGVSGNFERLHVRVTAPRGGDAALADSVTDAVLRALRRT